MAIGVNATKTPGRPSHEAIESTGEEATEAQKIDRIAMEGAKRAQNRIHDDEGKVPGSSIFTK